MKLPAKQNILFILFAFLLPAILLAAYFYFLGAGNNTLDDYIPQEKTPTLPKEVKVKEPPPPKTFTLAFTGDILLHSSVYNAAKIGKDEYDFTPFFRYVNQDIRKADLAICHLETLISGTEGVYSSYPRFQAPRQIADAIWDAGFDGCSIASNHTADGGAKSVLETEKHFNRVGLKYTGAAAGKDTVPPAVYYLDEKLIAHFSYTYGTNGLPVNNFALNLIDTDAIKKDIGAFKAEYKDSFIILSLHWGDEYQNEVSEYQKEIIEALRGEKIDLIVGHHAHVVQPILKVDNMYVLTGLGNFISAQIRPICNCPEEAQDGVIAIIEITETENSFTITDISLVPTLVDFNDFAILRAEKYKPTEYISSELLDASAKRTREVMEKYIDTGYIPVD